MQPFVFIIRPLIERSVLCHGNRGLLFCRISPVNLVWASYVSKFIPPSSHSCSKVPNQRRLGNFTYKFSHIRMWKFIELKFFFGHVLDILGLTNTKKIMSCLFLCILVLYSPGDPRAIFFVLCQSPGCDWPSFMKFLCTLYSWSASPVFFLKNFCLLRT